MRVTDFSEFSHANSAPNCDEHVVLARLGGDEFAIVIDGSDAQTKLEAATRSVARIFSNGYTYIDGAAFVISASMGSAVYPTDRRVG